MRFVWSGDTVGQGWGINPSFGGMKIYESMRRRQPLFFIHSGDTIYADGPIRESVVAENGQTWTNLVTPEVSKVAETLDEFRGRYRYNLLDENVRRFAMEPSFAAARPSRGHRAPGRGASSAAAARLAAALTADTAGLAPRRRATRTARGSAGCATRRKAEARVKLPNSATCTKYSSCFRSMLRCYSC